MKPEVIKTILLNECSSFNKNGFDEDISTYISLVEDKKYKQASYVYEKRLIPRYPDEIRRIRIIRYFRKGDKRFQEIYAGAVREIFERIVISVKKLINYISSTFEGRNNNPYEVLRKIDLALRVLPRAKEEGLVFVEKLGTYSVLLNYMPENFNIALDILRRYFDNTLFVKVKIEQNIKGLKFDEQDSYQEEKKKVTIDLDKIVFSDEEIKMICINSDIKSRSLQVLSYCRLYWRQIFNHDFEKKIFLYSKKYETNHFKIFQIIKNCRIKKIADEVILLEIYSLLSNSYQYSLQEDLFMQQVWRKIKPVDIQEDTVSAAFEGRKKADAKEKALRKKAGAKEGRKGKTREEAEVKRLRNIRYKTDAQLYSLHDRIQKFCLGDIFNAHSEFCELLPKHLEKHLAKSWKKGAKKDPYILKGAAHIITTFFTDNYKVVSPDWSGSLSNREVINIGFEVPELETIITLCIEELRIRRAAA
ncbi:MAG: hypothetical protein FWF38_06880 [Spirochaetaceae bacterium]|nr:hypothetical protein [Spirochaetaceae bacterium]